jgi:hypothetical protein
MKSEEQNLDRHPVLDDAFRVAVAVVGVATAITVLIMGIFAANSGDRIVTIAGLSVMIAGPAVLLLMILARLAFRTLAAQSSSHRRQRIAVIVTGIIYALGAPIILAGTWHLVRMCIDAPVDHEAAIEAPNSLTPAY